MKVAFMVTAAIALALLLSSARTPRSRTEIRKLLVDLAAGPPSAPGLQDLAVLRLSRSAEDNLKLPTHFGKLRSAVELACGAGDYLTATRRAKEMRAMLPERCNPDDDGSPFSPSYADYLRQWDVALTDLKACALDPSALDDYDGVLLGLPWGESYARSSAADSAARLTLLAGRPKEAIERLNREAMAAGPGCGNCMEGEQFGRDAIEAAWRIAEKPDKVAVPQLAGLVAGTYRAQSSRLSPDDGTWQVDRARGEAAYLLGEIYRKAGDREMAILAYKVAVMKADSGLMGRMAQTRIAWLSAPQ
jgi:hypothetical protein